MQRRTGWLRVIVVFVFLVMSARLAWFQVVKAEEVIARGEAYRLQEADLTPVRGTLKDRAGRYLAVSIPTRDVVAAPYHMGEKNFAKVAAALAEHLPLKAEELQRQFEEKRNSQYLLLAKGIDLETARQIQEQHLPGISLDAGARRTYPQGAVANQVIGYLDVDGVGAYGLEARYEKDLRGTPGFVRAELTSDQAPIAGTVKSHQPMQPGLDLTVTIDTYLNQIFEAALERVVKEQEAKRGLAIAIDIHTGEILAMAMRPGVDLNDRRGWLTADGKEIDFSKVTNWAVTPLPPGSIFKTVTTAIALEEGAIDLNTVIPDSGKLVIDGWTITNWDRFIPVQPRPMTIAELLQTSSNVGLMQVGQRIPRDTFVRYLESFGFMEPTGIDLSYEEGANGLEGFDRKADIDWANMYIGQHLEVTPLQMLRAVAAIANGGKLIKPHLVREARDPEGKVVWSADTKPDRTVISPQTASEMRELLISVVEKGSGSAARIPGYWVAGKTGTAQKMSGGQEVGLVADFVGFAPATDPQVAMIVLIDEPKPPGYGGVIAAPLFAELMPHVLRALAIPQDRPETAPAAPSGSATPAPEQVAVPDVRYLPIAWAEQKLTDFGLVPRRVGEGSLVAEQSIAAGAKAAPGATVELKLAAKPAGKLQVPDFRGLTLAEANRLAVEVGVTLKAVDGAGFVVEQSAPAGSAVDPGSVLTVRLSPGRSGP